MGLFIFIGLMMLLSFIYHYEPEDRDAIKARKVQTEGMFKESVLRKRLDEIVDEKVKGEKILKTEEELLQAGFNIKYSEFLIIKLLCGFVMSMAFGVMMNNILLAILFFLIGFFTPYQIVGFIRNKRIAILEGQSGSFMQMVVKRYESTMDFNNALKLTAAEFKGEEPMYSELNITITDISLGTPIDDALENLAKRTGNKYIGRFAAYYKVASTTGVPETRKNLMMQAYFQYEESNKLKRMLKKEIQGPVSESYIMLAFIPLVALYQATSNVDYIPFMTQTFVGKVGTTVIMGVLIFIAWFINAKIAAPID